MAIHSFVVAIPVENARSGWRLFRRLPMVEISQHLDGARLPAAAPFFYLIFTKPRNSPFPCMRAGPWSGANPGGIDGPTS